jgi:hypothetical protein
MTIEVPHSPPSSGRCYSLWHILMRFRARCQFDIPSAFSRSTGVPMVAASRSTFQSGHGHGRFRVFVKRVVTCLCQRANPRIADHRSSSWRSAISARRLSIDSQGIFGWTHPRQLLNLRSVPLLRFLLRRSRGVS